MAKKRDEDKLIFLLPEDVMNQLDRIFERLAEDQELRARFTVSPAEVFRELGVDVPPDIEIDLVNRVIFYLIRDEKFIAWSHNYNEELRSRYGDTITVDKEIGETIAKDVDLAIREHLPPGLEAEYTQAFGVAYASVFFAGIAILLFVAAVFNAAALVNAVALWNVGASIDHLVGLDIGINQLVRAALLLLVSANVSAAGAPIGVDVQISAGAPFGVDVQISAGGPPVGVGVRVGGVTAWGGPDG